jgi:cytochrome P450
LVLDDGDAIPGAVEEILRFNPPSQYQGRFTTEDVHLESGTIPAGSPTLGQVPGAGVRTIGCDGLRINQVDDVMSINSLHL